MATPPAGKSQNATGNQNSREFEVCVGRIATDDLAYVWCLDKRGKRVGDRFPLKRALVLDSKQQVVAIKEGDRLMVESHTGNPQHIISARLLV